MLLLSQVNRQATNTTEPSTYLSLIHISDPTRPWYISYAVFFFLSFFLPLGRDARWPRLANQVRVRQPSVRPPCLGPSPCGASSAVPKDSCLVAQSAAECCCCLRSTDKRPIQLSHLHAELRLRLPVPSSTCRFCLFSITAGLFLPAYAKCLKWTAACAHQFHCLG